MPGLVAVGLQFGDEGKGKIVDYLAKDSQMVVRFSGGNNAGHTIVHNNKTYKLHVIPSGILYKDVKCVIGSGTVIDITSLLHEIRSLVSVGIDISNLYISDRAHVILPIHKERDNIQNQKSKIGTTGRGIGPTYTDKVKRTGIRIADLSLPLSELKDLLHSFEKPESFAEGLKKQYEQIKKFIVETQFLINYYIKTGNNVLFEGAQGALLDVDYGTYPFVTSSNSIASFAAMGSGVGPTSIDAVIGITKAYMTRVGNGPFPTYETDKKIEEKIRKAGNEYGATTGRPRDCGWLDLTALRYASEINGISYLAVTKLDVLSKLKQIKISQTYNIEDRETLSFPSTISKFKDITPTYKLLDSWGKDISSCKKERCLPNNAKELLQIIKEAIAYQSINISHIGVGQGRNQIIENINIWKDLNGF